MPSMPCMASQVDPKMSCSCFWSQRIVRSCPSPHAKAAPARLPPVRSVDPLCITASTDPTALQDVIVGGAVTAAVGAALYSGFKQEPVPCDLCAGNGGIKCFACSDGSRMDVIDPDILQAGSGSSGSSTKRLTRGMASSSSGRPGLCRVCKGKGLVLCSKCKGSGYISTF